MESTNISSVNLPAVGLVDSLAKKLVLSACRQIREGHLVIADADGVYHFGEPEHSATLCAKIDVHDITAYYDFFIRGTVGSGEAFMRRTWTTPDLLSVIRLMVCNIAWLSKFNASRPWLTRILLNIGHRLNSNSRKGSRKNIAAHYDLGNEFFSLFLDPTMMYSAAVYPNAKASLEQASLHKLETVCQKLDLQVSDHLLEIGTGWGGMAIYAAQKFGCRVTTTTISKEQYEFARHRVEALGLEKQVQVLFKDYRELKGSYDKIVSIEMIEAVGHEFYDSYFRLCSSLLKDNGLMLIQAITIPDQRYETARKSTDFIKKYIFPGGCLPSNEVIARCVSRYTDMQIVDLHDITDHYAKTLAEWFYRFKCNLGQVKAQGFDEQFCRMWEFYLRYCEGGFKERVISTSQILFAKPGYRFAVGETL